jgi:GT2 family glycosyltransferase
MREGAAAVPATAPVPLVSVIVCTSGKRLPALRTCLASLRTVRDPHYEIVVVDNSATGGLAADELVRAGCRVVHEPRRGLDRARTRGIRETAGELVAFVDDDCEVDPDWLAHVRAAFTDDAVGCVTGRVRPAALERPSERWFEAWFSFDRGGTPRRFAAGDPGNFLAFPGALGTGCNMTLRRSVLRDVGPFDERIGAGTAVGGGDDIDMFARVLDAGHHVAYTPDALVHHHHRTTIPALRWQFFYYGVSFSALHLRFLLRRPTSRAAIARHAIVRIREHHVRGIRARLRGHSEVPLRMIAIDLAGIAWGPFAYAGASAAAALRRVGGRPR